MYVRSSLRGVCVCQELCEGCMCVCQELSEGCVCVCQELCEGCVCVLSILQLISMVLCILKYIHIE